MSGQQNGMLNESWIHKLGVVVTGTITVVHYHPSCGLLDHVIRLMWFNDNRISDFSFIIFKFKQCHPLLTPWTAIWPLGPRWTGPIFLMHWVNTSCPAQIRGPWFDSRLLLAWPRPNQPKAPINQAKPEDGPGRTWHQKRATSRIRGPGQPREWTWNNRPNIGWKCGRTFMDETSRGWRQAPELD